MEEGNAPQEPGPETIHKTWVKDLKPKEPVHTVFKVTHKARQTGRTGKPYAVVTLGDRTGEVDARIFDRLETLEALFLEGDFVLVKGQVTTWKNHPQIVIEAVDRLDPEPIDPADFQVPPRPAPRAPEKEKEPAKERPPEDRAARPDAARHVAQIRELVDRVQDGHVRALLVALLEDDGISQGLSTAPAAKGVHHAYKGGLAEHILSVMRLAHRIADHYPMADRDLLIAGALLHDLYKVKEIVPERGGGGGFEYSDEGRLVGHLVMAAQKIHHYASRIPGFPTPLEHHLTHIVLAHHGQLDWGSPKEPMTLEALLVHLIDTVDSRVASWLEIMERDPGERWTDGKNLYGRHLWKAAPPTQRGRSPLEGRPHRAKKSRSRKRDKDRDRGPAPAPAREPRDVPSFKPLRELASAPPAQEGGQAAAAEAAPPVLDADRPAE